MLLRRRSASRGQDTERQLVAAVCFRILSTGIEFLLVRTRRGRWTFPKGGVEPGLTHAQSAALEASEEAGVHGRIEEVAFTRYQLRGSPINAAAANFVHAHLCEVMRQDSLHEPDRNPTWFSSDKAKRRLAQGRSDVCGAELARVVDRAVSRIRRFPSRSMLQNDPLLDVQFEPSALRTRLTLETARGANGNQRATRILQAAAASPNAVRGRAKILQLPSASDHR